MGPHAGPIASIDLQHVGPYVVPTGSAGASEPAVRQYLVAADVRFAICQLDLNASEGAPRVEGNAVCRGVVVKGHLDVGKTSSPMWRGRGELRRVAKAPGTDHR